MSDRSCGLRFSFSVLCLALCTIGLPAPTQAQGQAAPEAVAGGTSPLLRLSNSGPLSSITTVAFSPNGQAIYAGGWDKVVHVWTRQQAGFVYDPNATYRIPVGGGLDGGINVLAISDDGQWLAVGGRGAKRGVAGQRDAGYLFPSGSLGEEAWLDEGQIFVFNTRTRQCRTLRGHPGATVALSFAPIQTGHAQTLVSICATERGGKAGAQIAVWNVESGKLVAKTDSHLIEQQGKLSPAPLPAVNVAFPPRPVAIWNGPGELDMRVALTWGVPKFGLRLWDLRETAVAAAVPDDPIHYFTLEGHEGTAVLSGGGGNTKTGKIELGRWLVKEGQKVLRRTQDYTLLHAFQAHEYVTNIGAGTKEFGRCAVVMDMQQKKAKLVVFNPAGDKISREHPLWDGMFAAAFARASREGSIAIAQAGAAEIQVFNAVDLQQAVSPQILKIPLPRMEQIAFVKNGEQPGLKVRYAGLPDAVFNFQRRTWIEATPEWTNQSLSAADWKVTPGNSAAGQLALSVTGPNHPASEIDVRARAATTQATELSAATVFPGSAEFPVPWMICALRTGLIPELQIYDLRTGEQLRQLTAHTGLIRDIAVSQDGRLVATVADDHTLCVWSVSDIPQQLGKHGLIRKGNNLLKVEVRDGKLAAANTIDQIPEGAQLNSGKVADATHTFRTGKDFYQFFHARKPGEDFILQTDRGDVKGLLGETITDRKPLFSIFVAPVGKPASWKWIGWHPQGPYEASDRDAESYLGWHFNTGDPNSPTRFAAAEGYRDEYETPQLLSYLYQHETLPERLPPPPPTMSLIILDSKENLLTAEFDGLIPFSDARMTAMFQAAGRGLAKRIAKVEFVLQNETAPPQVQPAVKAGQEEWKFDLSTFQFQRGRNRLIARLTTNEFPQRVFEEALGLRYQPPAPQVSLEMPALPVPAADFELKFTVTPSVVPADVLLRHRNEKGGVVAEMKWSDPTTAPAMLSQSLKLVPGINRVEVTVSNVQALYGFESAETSSQTIEIPYQEPIPPSPPKLSVTISRAGETAPLEVSSGGNFEIDSPEIALAARVDSKNPVQKSVVLLGEQETVLDDLNGQQGELSVSKVLRLQPGANVVQLQVQAGPKELGRFTATVNYRPQLPEFSNIELAPMVLPGQESKVAANTDSLNELILTEGIHKEAVQLSGSLQQVEPGVEFEIAVVVDDVVRPEIEIKRDGDKLGALVPIRPGQQRIKLRMSNAWQRVTDSNEGAVVLRRPPQIEMIEAPLVAVMNSRIENLELVVKSPQDLPPDPSKLQVELNNARIPCDAVVQPIGEDRWKVTLKNMVLDREGENVAKIYVANEDGRSSTAAVRSWSLMTPPKPKPVISVLGPGAQTRYRSVVLEFSVTSEVPLQAVKVERMIAGIPHTLGNASGAEAALLSAEKNDDGTTIFKLSTQLMAGPNHLLITAVNEGGSQTEKYSISYVPIPVQMEIRALGEKRPTRKDEQLQFDGELPKSHNQLTGVITWDISDPDQAPPEFVQFWVNGFMQQSVTLKEIPGEENKKEFRANLIMTRGKQNKVEMSVPGFPVNAESIKHTSFEVDCKEPQNKQNLQLLIVGGFPQQDAPPDYGDMLEKRAREALAAKISPGTESGSSEVLTSDAFKEIQTIVLTGRKATEGKVNAAIIGLRYRLQVLAKAQGESFENTVLILYYHGHEKVVQVGRKEEFVLSTTDNWQTKTDALGDFGRCLTSYGISQRLNTYFGAHLIFLDVQSDGLTADTRWPDDPHLGIIRTVWNDGGSDGTPRLMSAIANTPPNATQLGDLLTGFEQTWRESGPIIKDFNVPQVLKELNVRGATLQ